MSRSATIKFGAILLAMCAAAVQALPTELTRLEENVYSPSDCDSFSSVALNRCAGAVGREADTCFDLAMQSRRQCQEDLAAGPGPAKYRFEFAPGTTAPSLDEAMEKAADSDGGDGDATSSDIQDRAIAIDKKNKGQVSLKLTCYDMKCCRNHNMAIQCDGIQGISKSEKEKCKTTFQFVSDYCENDFRYRKKEESKIDWTWKISMIDQKAWGRQSTALIVALSLDAVDTPVAADNEACYDLANQSRRQCREDLGTAGAGPANFRFEFVPGTTAQSANDATQVGAMQELIDEATHERAEKKQYGDFDVPLLDDTSGAATRYTISLWKDCTKQICCTEDAIWNECPTKKSAPEIPEIYGKRCISFFSLDSRSCWYYFEWYSRQDPKKRGKPLYQIRKTYVYTNKPPPKNSGITAGGNGKRS
ncbi:hypothetical protein HDU96_005653 [Phlyctochytrium bullatum]|nr:hypothetical protein HDU96_005653 [Phlyctochytrium bullatum]